MKIELDDGGYFSVEAVSKDDNVSCVFTMKDKGGKLCSLPPHYPIQLKLSPMNF